MVPKVGETEYQATVASHVYIYIYINHTHIYLYINYIHI